MKIFRAIANVFFAALILLSTTGVTLHKHYCMGSVKDVTVFENFRSCMAAMGFEEDEACPTGCCKDVSQELKVDNLAKTVFNFYSTPDLSLISIVFYELFDINPGDHNSQTAYLNYKPPLIDHDIQLLVQSFLL